METTGLLMIFKIKCNFDTRKLLPYRSVHVLLLKMQSILLRKLRSDALVLLIQNISVK